MAGKHTGAYASGGTAVAGFRFDPKTDKAYAEGRAGSAANGHTSGDNAYIAWVKGDARKAQSGEKYETATP